MKIAIGADHRGYRMKKALIEFLQSKHHSVIDLGSHDENPCDYPDYGWKVAQAVSLGKVERGLLVCHTGVGQSIIANKARRVRAALVTSLRVARLSREHNHSNVLVFSSLSSNTTQAKRILSVWLKTRPMGGRHARRVKKISIYERRSNKSS
jgi:RpiB/LacA/LacB family sugar-phosphate isomerase